MSRETLEAAGLLCPPGSVAEVRVIAEDGTGSGYYNCPGMLATAVDTLDGLPGIQGIYVTLNEVNPALFSRRANRIKTRLGKKDATTADSDILRRRWFPIDIDPARPSGVSSTDREHQAAIDTAARVAGLLQSRGWPAPVIADSGNGAHLLYRIDLPNDDHSRDLVRQCLVVLAALSDDGTTAIDTANHNAARIWKLYGTMSRKGDNTADRPHRRSKVLSVPATLETVSIGLLEELASTLPSAPPGPATRTGSRTELGAWLHDHGIGVSRKKPWQGGTLYVLEQCPFSGAHRDGAFAIQFGNGAIHAGCQHTSCGGGSQRWTELREKYEGQERGRPDGPGHTRREGHLQGPAGTGGPPVSLTLAPDEIPSRTAALEVLQHGDPKQFMLRTFALDHVGDEVPAECLILSLASRSVANTNGLHVSVTGESGKGKSHAFTTLLQQVPERYRLAGRMSNKALFYVEDLQPGSAIVLDDTMLSDDMAEILKGVTTSFREPFLYRTVSKDRRGQVCTIPERCIWWVAKVEGAGDDQVFNRMLTCWIDESAGQDDRVLARVLERDQTPPGGHEGERPGVLACQAIWEIIGRQMYHVIIPFATRIRFVAHSNRRNPEMLLDLIKANTVLRFMQREQATCGKTPCLTATVEDFREAVRLYRLLNGIAGGQETKLTRKESELIDIISRNNQEEFTIPQLQKLTGWSSSSLHRLIHGYESRGCIYSGLLEKCPAISFCDRTVVSDGEAGWPSMRRRTNAYTFDQDLFRSWSQGGGIWLDDDPDNPLEFQQSPSNPLEPAAQFENQPAGSDPENNTYNKDIYLRSDQSPSKSRDTQNDDPAGRPGTRCLCEPENAEIPGDTIGKSGEKLSFHNPAGNNPPFNPLENDRPAEGMQQCCGKAGPVAPPSTGTCIGPEDYKPLDVPGDTIGKSGENPSFHNPAGNSLPFNPLENDRPAEGMQQCCMKPGPVAPPSTGTRIRPEDYKPLDVPGDTIGKSGENPSFHNPAGNSLPFHPLENDRPAEGMQQCCGKAGPVAPPSTGTRIRPEDYKPLDVPDRTYCRLCGSPWTHYVEKLTPGRKSRPKDQWQPYQVCKECYASARKRVQQSATVLPGTVDPARMERLSSVFCRCTVCRLDDAVYIDRSSGIKLCEACYQRIASQQEHGKVAG